MQISLPDNPIIIRHSRRVPQDYGPKVGQTLETALCEHQPEPTQTRFAVNYSMQVTLDYMSPKLLDQADKVRDAHHATSRPNPGTSTCPTDLPRF